MRQVQIDVGERGVARPVWLAVGVVTCVIFGSTLNKCLTCSEPVQKTTHAALAPVDSEPINPIDPEPAPPAPEVESDEPATGPEGVYAGPPATDNPGPANPGLGKTVESEDEDLDGEDPDGKGLGTIEPRERPKLEPIKKAPVPKGLRDHKDITFDFIADYTYEFPEDGQKAKDQIPEKIKAFHEKRVAIKGFMIPVKTEGDQVTEFVLVRNQGACCWGVVPRMNEWIHVKMEPGKFAPYAIDIPITVFGTLEVGEVYEDGLIMSVYRMRGVHVVEPPLFK